MFESHIFNTLFVLFSSMSIIVLLILIVGRVEAPYGKLKSKFFGSITMNSRLGWIIMESPSSIIFIILLLGDKNLSYGTIVLFFIWQFHYFYRTFIYPFRANHSAPLSIFIVIMAFIFQLLNTYFQAGWIFVISPESMYRGDYLYSVPFILGLSIFIIGTIINRHSDFILKNLRKKGETEYKIPYGGLYKFVSCPNFLGEIIIWLGWAIMLKGIIGFSFFAWTIANLVPRAMSTHRWYLNKFPDYPKDRKAIIPYIL